MKKLIIFNWKMNLADFSRLDNAKPASVEIVVCPPFTHIERIKKLMSSKIKLGAQNCFWENSGAYTGEISPKILKDLGLEYVITGHSERRKYLEETDEMINKKVSAVLKAGLKAVLCVGEDSQIRRRGLKSVKDYVKSQLRKDLKGILNKSYGLNLIVAYEPVWAIGTGNPCHPKDALEMIKFIKQTLNSKVLYGGSVDGKNIKNYVKYPEIDGALVGGASLRIKEVKKIINL